MCIRDSPEGPGYQHYKLKITKFNSNPGTILFLSLIHIAQYGDGDAARSKDAASAFIADGCVGVFGCNEGSTVGVGNAIKESGADVVGVGFDSSDNVLELINEGCLYATMVQNPDVMGYEGVKAAVAALQGGTADGAVTDTGVTVVTK